MQNLHRIYWLKFYINFFRKLIQILDKFDINYIYIYIYIYVYIKYKFDHVYLVLFLYQFYNE